MKLRSAILLSVLLGFFSGVRTAPAQLDAAVRQELEAQYSKLAEAHEVESLQAILALKTPDFHAIFPDGRVGDAKTMEEYSKQFLEANQPPYNIRVTIQELAVSENRLIAVAEVLQEVTRHRELAGKLRRVDTSVLQRETWAKTAGGWKLKSVDSVRDQKRFVDGKRVDPTKPYDPDAPPYSPSESATPTPSLAGAATATEEVPETTRLSLHHLESRDAAALLRTIVGIKHLEVIEARIIELRDTPERLLLAQQLVKMVDPPDDPPHAALTHEVGDESVIAVLPLRHVSAKEAMSALRSLPVRKIAAISEPTIVVIRDNEAQVRTAIQLLERLDQPRPE